MMKMFAAMGFIATLAAPAQADGHSWQIGNDSFHIYYTESDMNSMAGRAALLRRIERAAARLCRDSRDRKECAADTVRGAARDVRGGSIVRLALSERDGVGLAAR